MPDDMPTVQYGVTLIVLGLAFAVQPRAFGIAAALVGVAITILAIVNFP